MSEEKEVLKKRIQDLEKNVDNLQRRLQNVEAELNIEIKETPPSFTTKINEDMKKALQEKKTHARPKPAPKKRKPTPTPKPSEPQPTQPVFEETSRPSPEPTMAQSEQAEKTQASFEQLLGIWLPRVFMFVLILGVLWGLKLGMDYGWISYKARIAFGYLITALIFYYAYRHVKKGHKLFGITLISGVIAIGILITMAAYYLYNLINYPTALTISLIYIILGFIMSKQTKSEVLTVFSGFAGFLLPYLISSATVVTWTYAAYILILFLSLFYLAVTGSHRFSYYLTFFFFHTSLMFFAIFIMPTDDKILIVGTAIIQHLFLIMLYLAGFIKLKISHEVMVYVNVAISIAWVTMLDETSSQIAYGGLAAIYIAIVIYGLFKKQPNMQAIFSAVSVFAVSAFILSFNPVYFENSLTLLIVNASVGYWVGLYFKTLRTIAISSFIYVLTALTIFSLVSFEDLFSPEHLSWLTFILSTVVITRMFYHYRSGIKLKVIAIDRALIAVQIMILIYIVLVLNTFFVYILDDSLINHLYIFVLLIAVVFSFLLYQWKHGKYLAYAASIELILLGFLLMGIKMVDDFSFASVFFTNFGIEIIYVATITYFLKEFGRGELSILSKNKQDSGHIALIIQIVYFAFLTRWYFAIAAFFYWTTDYVYITHTIWMLLFAFLSVTLGGRFKWKAVQYIGLGLIGFSLIKLFFVDLANVSLVIRTVLFIIVGVIGLVYSRTLQKN